MVGPWEWITASGGHAPAGEATSVTASASGIRGSMESTIARDGDCVTVASVAGYLLSGKFSSNVWAMRLI